MNKLVLLVIIAVLLVGGFYAFNSYIYDQKQADPESTTQQLSNIEVTPITHASLILKWDDEIIYVDPTGGAAAYEGQPPANMVLVTDIHSDHMNPETLSAVTNNASLIAPHAVFDALPDNLSQKAQPLINGDSMLEHGFTITAVPMYNLPESSDSRHIKGRGNGYIIEKNDQRVYVAGDTSGTPEMRALTDIDMAFVPMNMPFTMSVEEAAEAVLAFKPKIVYPYHYRGPNGLADVNKFKELVNAGDENITVMLLEWYPEQ
jgi:L-ascorbate metabolism protein UlaG (beta-lactamase superfamily)